MRNSGYIAVVLVGTVALIVGVWMFSGVSSPESAALTKTAVPPPAVAPSAVEMVAEAGGADGYSYAVAVHESLAVFSRGARLVVVDVSNPPSPVELGSIVLPGEIRDIVMTERYAYVAADSAGMHVVDLADPMRPARSGSYLFDDRAYGVAVEGPHLFVAARSAGLRMLNVSSPSSPVEVGHIVTPDEAVDVVVRDGYAYVSAWYESMRVIDVSDPAALEEVSFASYDSYDNGAAWSVSVEGDIGLNTIPEVGLRTVDISDPHDVKLYKVYRGLFAPVGVAARGPVAFVADQDAGFRVLDLADPAELVEIGSLKLPGSPLSVVLNDDFAYVAAREGGLRVVDVSRPNDPVEVAFLDGDDEIVDVTYYDGVLIAAGAENGVYTFDGTDRLEPAARGAALRVVADGQRLTTAGTDGVHVYDRANPWTPVTSLNSSARAAAVRGDLTVAATELDGLVVFDGARQVGESHPERLDITPSNRELLLRTPVSGWDVVLHGNIAFGAFDDGIRLVDVSTPSRPALIGSISTPERVYRLAAHDATLLAACDDGLRIFDIETRKEIAHIKTSSFATAVVAQDGRAYVGDLNGSVTVVELAEKPETIGTYEVADRVHGLAVSGEMLAVAAGTQGIRIVRLAAATH